MQPGDAGLDHQPFAANGVQTAFVPYVAQRSALQELRNACAAHNGLALLQGPPLSGKSTLLRAFTASLPVETAIAIVDGANQGIAGLLESMLRRFGYQIEFNSTGELLAMIRVFVMQQAGAHEPPIVIIHNAHAMNPSALRATAELAELRVRQTCAVKFVLVSDESLQPIIDSPGLEALGQRRVVNISMEPMSESEAVEYLHHKLRAAGCKSPEAVFPAAVCHEIWEASGGWPGLVDRVARLALEKADDLPIALSGVDIAEPESLLAKAAADEMADAASPSPANGEEDGWNLLSVVDVDGDTSQEVPRLIITENGKTLEEVPFERSRLLIGRSTHNDLAIDSSFISRHHLLLVRHGSLTLLMDLNSTNGTTVNSRRVSNHVLIDNDIISLGNHRIKFCDPNARSREDLEGVDFADTAIMRSLGDMRSLLKQENTAELPLTENIPTYGN